MNEKTLIDLKATEIEQNNAALRVLLRRTLGRIKDVDDPRARRAAGEIEHALGLPAPIRVSGVAGFATPDSNVEKSTIEKIVNGERHANNS